MDSLDVLCGAVADRGRADQTAIRIIATAALGRLDVRLSRQRFRV